VYFKVFARFRPKKDRLVDRGQETFRPELLGLTKLPPQEKAVSQTHCSCHFFTTRKTIRFSPSEIKYTVFSENDLADFPFETDLI
jgi:hypothetical protein